MHAEHLTHSLDFGWVSILLSLLFLGGTAFYLFRLISPGYLRTVNGYFDGENEFWHAACLLGMSGCLTPAWLPLPNLIWLCAFGIGTAWYVVRGFTYGRRLKHNKQWYDFAHAAMLFGMWWMFAQPLQHVLITVAFAAYWTWFGSYYVYRLSLDVKKPSWLAFGQDGAHLLMSVVMLVMTVWPAAFEGHSHHHHAVVPANPAVAVEDSGTAGGAGVVALVADADFESKVTKQAGAVVVLVSGGCINCATEVPVFERVASTLSNQAQFVRLHKDDAPNACAWLHTKECPALVIVKDGKVVARLDGFADHDAMERFLSQHLKP